MADLSGQEYNWRVVLNAGEAEASEVLSRDRVWNCFALADLAPPFGQYTEVAVAYHAERPPAACLLLRHPAFTVLSPAGDSAGVEAILARLDLPARTAIQAQALHLAALDKYYRPVEPSQELIRMYVRPATFRPVSPAGSIRRLTPSDLEAVLELYRLFPENVFRPDELEHGLYYGLYDGQQLAAIGGTHVLAPAYRISVLGGIFTHPDHRRRGYSQQLTGQLVSDLLALGCDEVVLNVFAANTPAIQLYQKLGFQSHCHYWNIEAELSIAGKA